VPDHAARRFRAFQALASGAANNVRAADFFTAPVLVRQNELVTCQAMNIGITTLDVMVDLIEAGKGNVFGPANCVGTVKPLDAEAVAKLLDTRKKLGIRSVNTLENQCGVKKPG